MAFHDIRKDKHFNHQLCLLDPPILQSLLMTMMLTCPHVGSLPNFVLGSLCASILDQIFRTVLMRRVSENLFQSLVEVAIQGDGRPGILQQKKSRQWQWIYIVCQMLETLGGILELKILRS
jgi:hypothetical protein